MGHLGNTRVVYHSVINCAADSIHYMLEYAADYYPFGAILREWENCEKSRFLSTYKERDAETGWDNLGARLYDSDIGRFLGVDPIADQFPHVNSYNYAENEPVANIDLHGLQKVKTSLLQKALHWLGWDIRAGGTNLAQPQSAEQAAEYSDRSIAIYEVKEGLQKVLDVQKTVIPGTESLVLAHEGDVKGAVNAGVGEIAAGLIGGAILYKFLGKLFQNSRRLGGLYKDLDIIAGKEERHHIPADAATDLSREKGPAIVMGIEDHRKTASWGSSREAKAYRKTQADLIQEGRFEEAQGLDIKDIRNKFGKKYDKAIRQMKKKQ